MINAMKYIRNFVLVALSLQSSFAVASDTKRMPFPQSFPVSLSSSKGGSAPINLKLLSPLFNNLSKFDFSKFNPYNIDLSGYKSVIADGITNTSDVVMNNPKKSLVAAALVTACMGSYYCISRELISKERVSVIKAFLIKHSQAFGTSCFNILPNEAQGAILLLTRPFQMLGGMIMNYATHHKKYVGLTALFALGGRAASWDGTGYTFAGIAFAYGAFASRFDRLEEQNDETHKKINDLQDRIIALGSSVDKQIEGVSAQVTDVQSTVKEIQDGIGTLKNDLLQLDKGNKEAATQLQTRITNLEISLKDNLENRLQVLSGELKKEIAAVEVRNQEKADAIQKDLNGLTELVNKHQLSNIEDFKKVREFFTQSLSALQVTLKEEINQLRGEVQSLHSEITEGLKTVDTKIDNLGAGITAIDQKVEQVLSEKIGDIQSQLTRIDKAIESYTAISSKDQVEFKQTMMKRYDSFDVKLNSLVSLNARVTTLEEKQGEQQEFNSTILQLLEEHIKAREEYRKKTEALMQQMKVMQDNQATIMNAQEDIKVKIDQGLFRGDQRFDELLDAVKQNKDNAFNAIESSNSHKPTIQYGLPSPQFPFIAGSSSTLALFDSRNQFNLQ